ncbi:hypothetical protein OS176_02540 [Xanthomonadaceae bacterium XH05]|nr:hypothetical protein [Xanthomonadaceae bacterium XH05]
MSRNFIGCLLILFFLWPSGVSGRQGYVNENGLIAESLRNASPVGAIVYSIADYKAFMEMNGYPPGDWVPCDGRELPKDSLYAIHVSPFAPDLRGVFLRGVNEMEVGATGVAPVAPGRGNPENKMAGQYQEDAFASHKHGFSRGKYGGSNPASFPADERKTHGDAEYHNETRREGAEETRPRNVSGYFYLKIR